MPRIDSVASLGELPGPIAGEAIGPQPPRFSHGDSAGWHTRGVAATLAHIDREELWQKLQRRDDFVLVDALSPMSYALQHLPGAINITPAWVDDRARRRIPDLDTEVVVYCASDTCDSSVEVAARLVELGYRNVRHYSGGKRDWVDAGLPVEPGRS